MNMAIKHKSLYEALAAPIRAPNQIALLVTSDRVTDLLSIGKLFAETVQVTRYLDPNFTSCGSLVHSVKRIDNLEKQMRSVSGMASLLAGKFHSVGLTIVSISGMILILDDKCKTVADLLTPLASIAKEVGCVEIFSESVRVFANVMIIDVLNIGLCIHFTTSLAADIRHLHSDDADTTKVWLNLLNNGANLTVLVGSYALYAHPAVLPVVLALRLGNAYLNVSKLMYRIEPKKIEKKVRF